MNATKSYTTALLLVLLLPLAAPSAQAQCCVRDSLFFASAPGQRPMSLLADLFESDDGSRLDANGNGTNEVIILREDDQGNPIRFIAYDMALQDSLFVIDLMLPDYAPIRNGQMRFEGFYDYLGEGTKAATFGGSGVILVTPEDTSEPAFFDSDPACRFVGVSDFNDDNKQDLVIRNTQLRRVEIYTFFEED